MYKETKASAPVVLKEEVLRNQPNGIELFSGIGGNFSSISEIICEMVDDPVSNLLHNKDCLAINNEIIVRFEDLGSRVGIMVADSGSGIRNLHNALTIAGRADPDTPLNSHGFGLKHALASCAAGGTEDWWIETRTQDNVLDNTFCRVSGPFRTGTSEDDPVMKILHCEGYGHVGAHTGTVVYTSCADSVFMTAKPNKKCAKASFASLVGYIIEHLRYTYAELLDSEKIVIKVVSVDRSGKDTVVTLMPLLPDWEDGTMQEHHEIKCNLGGGELLATIRYGQIRPSSDNAFYFKGNQDSSGVQVGFNGRVITNKLFGPVFGEAIHNSQNRFIAQIDLQTDNLEALPGTKNTKTSFSEGDPRYAALLKLIATYVPAPEKDLEKLEDKLKRQLAEQEGKDSNNFRADREEMVFRTAGSKALIDLYVAQKDGQVVIYEAKAHTSTVKDIGQLLMYILGCIYDGKPANEAVLIAGRHSKEVIPLIPVMNEMLAGMGIDCKMTLDTWNNRGISVPA